MVNIDKEYDLVDHMDKNDYLVVKIDKKHDLVDRTFKLDNLVDQIYEAD